MFNDQLRGPVPGSMALIPHRGQRFRLQQLPAALGASLKQLAVEKLPSGQGADLAVRDSNTGFTFFNIQGHQYNYDAAAQSLAITNGRLLVSKEFAQRARPAVGRWFDSWNNLHRSSNATDPRSTQLVNGATKSMVMPPMQHAVGPRSAKPWCRARMSSLGIIEDVEQPRDTIADTGRSGDRNRFL